jgi:hypothetical protein
VPNRDCDGGQTSNTNTNTNTNTTHRTYTINQPYSVS